MEKIALILIYWTWFSSSLVLFSSYVYFFCNVHVTIVNLAYFNPHNRQLAGKQLNLTLFPHSLSSVWPCGFDDGVTIHGRGRSMAISIKSQLFVSFFALFTHLFLIFYYVWNLR